MKRYSIFDYVGKPWWAEFYFIGEETEEKPMILIPKPVYWVLYLHRDIRIAYRRWRLKSKT